MSAEGHGDDKPENGERGDPEAEAHRFWSSAPIRHVPQDNIKKEQGDLCREPAINEGILLNDRRQHKGRGEEHRVDRINGHPDRR